MKLINAVNAYIAADEMSGQSLPYDLALALVRVKKLTRDEVSFFIEKERELVLRYAALDDCGNVRLTGSGTFLFKDPAKAQEYAKARLELGGTDTGIAPSPVTVKPPDSIKPSFVEALEDFITFAVEEE